MRKDAEWWEGEGEGIGWTAVTHAYTDHLGLEGHRASGLFG